MFGKLKEKLKNWTQGLIKKTDEEESEGEIKKTKEKEKKTETVKEKVTDTAICCSDFNESVQYPEQQ